jgi:pimeloyl-ACP methyl ester carboxylesterase
VRIAPERVSRLALLDTRSRPEEPAETERRHQFIRLAQSERGFTPVTTRLLPLLMHPSRVKEAALVDVIRDMAERTGVEAYVRQQTAIIGRPDFRPFLAKIACPTLVLCGREDALTPLSDSEFIAASIPGARLVVVEACGHMSTMERPEEVNQALRDWLEG